MGSEKSLYWQNKKFKVLNKVYNFIVSFGVRISKRKRNKENGQNNVAEENMRPSKVEFGGSFYIFSN